MSLPALSKTWSFTHVVNAVAGTILAQNQKDVRQIVTSFLSLGATPWTVAYSCDSTVAGSAGDGVNRWSADNKLVWGTGGAVRSWMVLKNTGLGNLQICIHCTSTVLATASDGIEFVVSVNAGFTGGSTTARPTATDEAVNLNTSSATGSPASDRSWNELPAAPRQSVMHMMASSDGQSWRMFLFVNGACISMLFVEKLQSPVTGLTYPYIVSWRGSAAALTDLPTYANYSGVSTTHFKGYNATAAAAWDAALTGEGIQNASSNLGSRLAVANDISGEFPFLPVGVYSETASSRGRHGFLADIWWGSSVGADGDTYPNDATKQFIHVKNLILPNDGTTWQLS